MKASIFSKQKGVTNPDCAVKHRQVARAESGSAVVDADGINHYAFQARTTSPLASARVSSKTESETNTAMDARERTIQHSHT